MVQDFVESSGGGAGTGGITETVVSGGGASALQKDLAISVHAGEKMAQRGISADAVRTTVAHGEQFSDSKYAGTVTHVLPGAGPEGRNLTAVTDSTRTRLVTTIDHTRPTAVSKARLTPIRHK